MKDKFRSALWLIKSVEQRQKTIHKVATSIINFQRDFLDHGIEHLRPLVLRDVANDIGMHESTVSRVVTNKYMHTPQGVFEMKYFFHSGISSSYGESVSSVTIKQRIRKIIEGEDPRKPLSDSKIVSILQREGLVLARRTIAKYREELKIPTSNQRKVLSKPGSATDFMRLELTGRHVEITPALRRLVDAKLARLERILNDGARVGAGRAHPGQVRAARPRSRCTPAARSFSRGAAATASWDASLGAVADKLEHQAQTLKGKCEARKRRWRRGAPAPRASATRRPSRSRRIWPRAAAASCGRPAIRASR